MNPIKLLSRRNIKTFYFFIYWEKMFPESKNNSLIIFEIKSFVFIQITILPVMK